MTAIVLVPGGWHGGWWFRPLVTALSARGHDVFAVTPTGLGERQHLSGNLINLDTHIQDVVATIEFERLDDVVLCGHSYGGTIITGVADRITDSCAALVYLDAQVPRDGESHWDLTEGPAYLEHGVPDGAHIQPPPGMDERASPHPLASFTQPIRLTGRWQQVHRRYYLWAGEGFGGGELSPTKVFYDRLRDDPDWDVHSWPVGHDLVGEALERLTDFIDHVAADAR